MKTNFHFSTQQIMQSMPVLVQNENCADYKRSSVTIKNEIPPVTIDGEVECTVAELKELWQLQKQVLKESPELLGTFFSDIMKVAVDARSVVKDIMNIIDGEDVNDNSTSSEVEEE